MESDSPNNFTGHIYMYIYDLFSPAGTFLLLWFSVIPMSREKPKGETRTVAQTGPLLLFQR